MRAVYLCSALSLMTATVAIAEEGAREGASSTAERSQSGGEGIGVEKAVVATGVENREPVGAATTFSPGTEKLYFYTAVRGNFGSEEVFHVWYQGGREVGRVPLKVSGPRFRTWSTKTIGAPGEWKVELVDARGQSLHSQSFQVGTGTASADRGATSTSATETSTSGPGSAAMDGVP